MQPVVQYQANKRENTKSPLINLPTNELNIVIKELSVSTLGNLLLTCHFFKDHIGHLFRDPQSVKEFFEKNSDPRIPRLVNHIFDCYFDNVKNHKLEILNAISNQKLSSAFICAYAQSLPTKQELDLSKLVINDDEILVIKKRLKNIRILNLNECKTLTLPQLQTILECLPTIETLKMKIHELNPEKWELNPHNLNQIQLSKLKYLEIRNSAAIWVDKLGCQPSIEYIEDNDGAIEPIQEFLSSGKQLKKFKFKNLYKNSDSQYPWEAIAKILNNLSNLIELDLYWTPLTNDELIQFAEQFPKIQKLRILKNDNLTPDGVSKALEKLEDLRSLEFSKQLIMDTNRPYKLLEAITSHCPNLEYLDIDYLSNEDFALISKLSKLSSLDLSGTNITDAELNSIAQACQSIKIFKVSDCRHLTSSGLKNALINLTELKELDISFGEIEDQDLLDIASRHKKLSVLRIKNCKKLTAPNASKAIAHLTELKTLECNSSHLSDDGLRQIIDQCKKIEYFIFDNRETLTNEGLLYLSNLRQLKKFDFYFNKEDIPILNQIAQSCLEYKFF